MFVAVDDTDSMKGNCTTFLATEIIRELTIKGSMDLIGYPCLIRLNPAIPWKTRGNGALCMRFGRGIGRKTFIGIIEGKEVWCFENQTDWEQSVDFLMKKIIPLVNKYHDSDNSDPGIVISNVRPSFNFYKEGVTRVVKRSDIEREIKRIGAKKLEWGCGRGIIGCICGMAWIPCDKTYELLSYRPQEKWGIKRIFDTESIKRADHEIVTSFNSWEDRFNKATIIPGTPCPVMYGLRGDVPVDLIRGHKIIKTESQSRWIIFETNQGTDDHIITNFKREEFIPNSSYLVKGTVESVERIKGGHTFIRLSTDYGELTSAAYRPLCEFRYALDWLVEGDVVEVMGELRDSPRTLNIEKLHVISTVEEYAKISNPICADCGRTMSSIGKGHGYRCRKCGTRSKNPVMRRDVRWIVPGWYEPPVTARRHLSKPLKRMGVQQPLEFVDCRN